MLYVQMDLWKKKTFNIYTPLQHFVVFHWLLDKERQYGKHELDVC